VARCSQKNNEKFQSSFFAYAGRQPVHCTLTHNLKARVKRKTTHWF